MMKKAKKSDFFCSLAKGSSFFVIGENFQFGQLRFSLYTVRLHICLLLHQHTAKTDDEFISPNMYECLIVQ